MSSTVIKSILIITAVFTFFLHPTLATSPHIINFKSPNLYPKSLIWDKTAQHFIVTSLRHPSLLSVSDAGVTNSLLSDDSIPPTSSFHSITIDTIHNRILTLIQSPNSNSALVAYHLHSPHHRLFLTTLSDTATDVIADVTVDFSGNAFITNPSGNFIWKVNLEGTVSILSNSKTFIKTTPVLETSGISTGLNGIAYCSKGYLIVSQSNTGNLYKVDSEDGTARKILLNKELKFPEGIAMRKDGVLLVLSQEKLYFVKSDNSWSDGVVYDETALEAGRNPSAVTVGAEDRVYMLYGHVDEGKMGNLEREEFSIVEVRSADESADDAVWIYVLIGFGLVYFLVWRFQMRQLFSNMDKKIA